MTWRWRSLAAIPDGGTTQVVLEGMLRRLLQLCHGLGHGLVIHRDRVLAIVDEVYSGEP